MTGKQIRFYGKGGTYKVGDSYDSVQDSLPVGVYSVAKDMTDAWWCVPYGGIEMPKRIYGNLATERAQLCVNAFDFRNRSTGFLLSGISGSGKTLTAKIIAHRMMTERKYPVFLIDKGIPGQALADIFGKITQPIVVLFEEIEKNYKDDEAESLLTLLDGVIPGKRLTIATCNEPEKLPIWFMNRPSRFYYHLKYRGYEEQAVTDMLADCDTISLERKEAVQFFARTSDMAFDAVGGIITEIQCKDSSMEEVMSRLNLEVQEIAGDMDGRRLFYLLDDDYNRIGTAYGEMSDDFSVRITGRDSEFSFYNYGESAKQEVKVHVCDMKRADGQGTLKIYEKDMVEIYPEWKQFNEVITKNGVMYMRGRSKGMAIDWTATDETGKQSIRRQVNVNLAFKLREDRESPLIYIARAADQFASRELTLV